MNESTLETSRKNTRNCPKAVNRRRAFTLVELLLAMTAGTTLMLLAVGLVHQSMTLNSITRGLQSDAQRATLFARQLRRDVYEASSAVVKDQTLTLSRNADSEQIIYTSQANHILRRVTKLGHTLQQERYDFRPEVSTEFAYLETPERVSARLLRQPQIAGTPPRVDRQIIAAVGRLTQNPLRQRALQESKQP